VQILQRTIAVGTPLRERGNLRVPRHGCRSHRASSTTVAGCVGILAHTGDWSNRLAASPPGNRVHFSAVASRFSSVEVSVRSTPTTKFSPPATFPRSVVHASRRAEGLLLLLFTD
jgi:hypothetical protein